MISPINVIRSGQRRSAAVGLSRLETCELGRFRLFILRYCLTLTHAERWVKSVKDECLSKLILFGEASLRRALREYLVHHHAERNHKGKANVLLFPTVKDPQYRSDVSVRCRERLGGLLKYYHREAA